MVTHSDRLHPSPNTKAIQHEPAEEQAGMGNLAGQRRKGAVTERTCTHRCEKTHTNMTAIASLYIMESGICLAE